METNRNPFATQSTARANVQVDAGLRAFMLGVYNYMAAALALTGIVALYTANSEALLSMFYAQNASGGYGMSGRGRLVAFSPLVAIRVLSFGINRLSVTAMQGIFWGFAVLMGLSMSSIFLAYTGASVARVFFITAITFGATSIYGYTTKRDLTGWGSFLFMGVIGLIVASIVNIFLQSPALYFAISYIGVLIFVGLTAYDTQRLKQVYYSVSGYGEAMAKASIMGALELYLDFINMFVYLLRIMGDRR